MYEYEPVGVPRGRHECTPGPSTFSERSAGCIGLISSGASTGESVFLDASESGGEGPHGEELSEGGGDVFFATAAKLVPQDTEGAFAAYDARECTAEEPCVPRETSTPPPPCEAVKSCRPFSYSPSRGASPASAAPSGQGNAQVLAIKMKAPPPKPLTRAQELARALKSCRAEHRHSRAKRVACEKRARRRYAPHRKKAKK